MNGCPQTLKRPRAGSGECGSVPLTLRVLPEPGASDFPMGIGEIKLPLDCVYSKAADNNVKLCFGRPMIPTGRRCRPSPPSAVPRSLFAEAQTTPQPAERYAQQVAHLVHSKRGVCGCWSCGTIFYERLAASFWGCELLGAVTPKEVSRSRSM